MNGDFQEHSPAVMYIVINVPKASFDQTSIMEAWNHDHMVFMRDFTNNS